MRPVKCLPLGLGLLSVKEVFLARFYQIAQYAPLIFREIILRVKATPSQDINAAIAVKSCKKRSPSKRKKQDEWVVYYLNDKENARINTKTGAIKTPKYEGRKNEN